jgi:hypothetical protein
MPQIATAPVVLDATAHLPSFTTIASTFIPYPHHIPRDSADGNLVFKFGKPPGSNLTSSAFNGTTPPPFYSGLHGVNIEMDSKLVKMMWLTIFLTVGTIFALRLAELFVSYIRTIYCMTATAAQQTYYTLDHFPLWSWLKKNLIYAPLLKKRHNRELQISSVVNYGTIPGRIHFLLLFVYALSQLAYCLMLDWKTTEKGKLYAELRGRSGILATVNMIPLVVLAGRNNPAIPLLRVSFDTYNLFHRWIGRIVAVESLIHFFAWMAAYIMARGDRATPAIFINNPFLQFGMIGIISIVILVFHSLSPIRHAFYETFLHLHQFLGFVAFLGIYVHLYSKMLPAFPFILTVVVFWVIERAWRIGRLVYLNYSRSGGKTSLVVEALPAMACRVTFQLPRHVTIRPGSHVYAYIPAISLWMSHPFSVAWTNVEAGPPVTMELPISGPTDLEGQTSTKLVASKAPTSVSLIVYARSGMTKKLYEQARQSNNNKLFLRGFLEGPYAGHDSMVSYGTVVMFAGGGGITHHLVQIRHLLLGAKAQTVATRKIVLVWSIRDVDAMEWVKPWMTEILAMEGRREVLSIRVYASKPSVPINTSKAKPTMQIIEGRANPSAVLDEVLPQRIGATMVSVCGPGALADEVRAAVRARLPDANISLNEESFTW